MRDPAAVYKEKEGVGRREGWHCARWVLNAGLHRSAAEQFPLVYFSMGNEPPVPVMRCIDKADRPTDHALSLAANETLFRVFYIVLDVRPRISAF